jgi:KUP system potassium uptake protein
MSLVALGVVYGDIGTSPLYAFQVALAATNHTAPTALEAIGIASLIIWALFITVTLKYIGVVLRADNEGEGGILALLSLVKNNTKVSAKHIGCLVLLGVLGAAFLYGDGMITPAISVLSAMEGIKVAAPPFAFFVIPVTVVVLIVLFFIQKKGTGAIGKLFGPIMVVWFAAIGAIGFAHICLHPAVLVENPAVSFAIFGAVFLALTGGEALYADMGHVGARAIRVAFGFVVLPCLVLNYLGQAALVIGNPAAAENPFYNSVPAWGLIPMIALAAAATIIASQALISGVYSLTNQAIQMNLLPRMKIIQTSCDEVGQIYVPFVNWALMAGTLTMVLVFRSSDALAAAYGIAVSGTMLITTILLYQVMVNKWFWSKPIALGITLVFGTIDGGFFAANSVKFFEGGWMPLLIGACITFIMMSWRSGTMELKNSLVELSTPLNEFLTAVDNGSVTRVPGCAIWMTKVTEGVTPMLRHHVLHNKALHKEVILFTVSTARQPYVFGEERVTYEDLGHGFSRIILTIGFMEVANVEACLGLSECLGERAKEADYFVGHASGQRKRSDSHLSLPVWLTFSFLKRFASRPSDFFQLPDARIEEVGLRLAL